MSDVPGQEPVESLKAAIGQMKENEYCSCEERCPCCGKRKAPKATGPWPCPWPHYPPEPPNPAPPWAWPTQPWITFCGTNTQAKA